MMSADEYRKKALEASKKEFEFIEAALNKAASQGSFTLTFDFISDGAVQQLKDAGYSVVKRMKRIRSFLAETPKVYYYEVSINPQ